MGGSIRGKSVNGGGGGAFNGGVYWEVTNSLLYGPIALLNIMHSL